MTTFKTPGVYVQEKNSFGSSIVANETAIPSFIGFTQKAMLSNGEELNEYMASFDGKVRAFLKDKVEKPVNETLEDLSTSANQDFKEIIDKIEKLEKALIKKTK